MQFGKKGICILIAYIFRFSVMSILRSDGASVVVYASLLMGGPNGTGTSVLGI